MAADARQSRRTLKGAAIIAALFGAALIIFFLSDIAALFERRYAVVVVVESAPGIVDGSPVWIGGRAVGLVTQIGFLPQHSDSASRLAITLELPRSTQSQVRTDSNVRLTSSSLIGKRVVDLLPGTAAAAMLRDGDTLFMRTQLTAEQLTARAAAVRAELDLVMVEMRRLAPLAGARMTDTRRAFAGLDAAMQEARLLSSSLDRSPAMSLLNDPAFAAALQRTRAHAGEVSALIERMRANSGGIGDVAAAMARLQLRADSLGAQLDAVALATEYGFLSRMQRDSAIVRALNAARVDLDSLIAEARRNPLRFFF